MKYLSAIRSILIRCCVWFTVLTLCLFLIGSAFPEFGNAIAVKTVLVLFAFSFLIACANLILGIPKIPASLRFLLHYAASLLAFYVLFVRIAMQATEARTVLTALILFTIFYALFMGGGALFRHSIKQALKTDKNEYQKIYK